MKAPFNNLIRSKSNVIQSYNTHLFFDKRQLFFVGIIEKRSHTFKGLFSGQLLHHNVCRVVLCSSCNKDIFKCFFPIGRTVSALLSSRAKIIHLCFVHKDYMRGRSYITFANFKVFFYPCPASSCKLQFYMACSSSHIGDPLHLCENVIYERPFRTTCIADNSESL